MNKTQLKLYEGTNANKTKSYVLASNINAAVNKLNYITSNGLLETLDKIEWVKDFDISTEMRERLGVEL